MKMASRSLNRMESWLNSMTLFTTTKTRRLSISQIHCQSVTHQKRHRRPILSQQLRHSSNIIKSPYQHIDIPNQLIQEMVWEIVDRFPESPAVKCGITHQTYTYAELQRKSFRLANVLRKTGFKQGDIVALVLPNCPDFAVVVLGALEAGLAVSFINHVYTADEICHQLKDSGSVCVVTGAAQLNTVQAAVQKVESATQSKPIRKVIVVDTLQQVSVPPGVTRFSEMIADGVDEARKSTNSVQVNDVALLPYSSGTTGLSKGVCLSHRNIVANTHQIGVIPETQFRSSDQGQDLVLGLLPFYHIYGLTCIVFNSLKNGSQIVTLPKFEQDTLVQTLDKEKVSIMLLVPPLMMYIGSSSKIKPKHLLHTRIIMSGAAPLGSSDMEKAKIKIPENCIITQGYGMTETSPSVLMPKFPVKNLKTVGAPLSQTLAKVIDLKTGNAAGPNQTGELCFKGPQVMLGYHNNPKATADIMDAEGWLRTGDLGFYDEDNHFYVQDRLKELIKVKGFQVPPAELEEVLRTHASVSDVGVIGVPDPRSGEVPVAYIVPAKGTKLTAEQILEFLSVKVSKHKQVSEVIFTDTIPKSAAGKILRKELKDIYNASHKQI